VTNGEKFFSDYHLPFMRKGNMERRCDSNKQWREARILNGDSGERVKTNQEKKERLMADTFS